MIFDLFLKQQREEVENAWKSMKEEEKEAVSSLGIHQEDMLDPGFRQWTLQLVQENKPQDESQNAPIPPPPPPLQKPKLEVKKEAKKKIEPKDFIEELTSLVAEKKWSLKPVVVSEKKEKFGDPLMESLRSAIEKRRVSIHGVEAEM